MPSAPLLVVVGCDKMAAMDWLLASAPDPAAPAELQLFAPLMGSWQLDVENLAPDGSVTCTDAEWHFDWALGGHAVIDVWISPSRPVRARTEPPFGGDWGMTVRFFDASIGRWRSTWHGPGKQLVIPFLGRPVEGGFLLEAEYRGEPIRWQFADISGDRFTWRYDYLDAGEWKTRQRFAARRTAGPRG